MNLKREMMCMTLLLGNKRGKVIELVANTTNVPTRDI